MPRISIFDWPMCSLRAMLPTSKRCWNQPFQLPYTLCLNSCPMAKET